MTALTSTLIVRLLDKVTGPAGKVGKSLDGIVNAARRAGRSGDMLGNLQTALDKNNRALDRARGRLFDATAGFGILAVAIGAPIKKAVEFEAVLEDIGQKLNMPQQQFGAFGKRIRQMARDTTQSASAVAAGFDTLAGLGADEGQATAMMKVNGRAATAYRADLNDLNNAGYAAMDNLKVQGAEYGRLMDGMAQAGKAGAFELRDMAQYFPALTAAYQGLGQKGVGAAIDLASALQITRKGAGDAASAATNLNNILQKTNAPQTRKAFKEMGVDLEREMKKAAAAGMTPIEAITEITNRTLKGDLSQIGDLFQDAQVQQGLRPLIQNLELYRKIRAEAMKAQGIVEEDYARRLKTSGGALQRLKVIAENVSLSIGAALLPAIASIAEKFAPVAEAVARFAEANPRLTRTILAVAAGLMAARVAMIAIQYAALLTKGGLLGMLVPFVRIATAARAAAGANIAYQATLAKMGGGKLGGIGKIAAGLRGIVMAVPGVGALGAAFQAVAVVAAGLSLPVVAFAAAIVAAGAVVYKYWEPIKAFFVGFGQGLAEGFAPLKPTFDMVASAISTVAGWFGKLLAPVGAADAMTKSWGEAGKTTGQAVAAAIKLIISPLTNMIDLIGRGIAKFQELKSKAGGAWQGVKNWWGGGGQAPAPALAGARAKGGPVRRGSSYLVGEEGPEIWTASASGSIIPNGESMAAIRAMRDAPPRKRAAAGATITQNFHFSFSGVTDREEMLREFSYRLGEEAKQVMRGIHADLGDIGDF